METRWKHDQDIKFPRIQDQIPQNYNVKLNHFNIKYENSYLQMSYNCMGSKHDLSDGYGS